MNLKFYFRVIQNKPELLDGQDLDSSLMIIDELQFAFAPNIEPKNKDCQILGLISFNAEVKEQFIVSVIEEYKTEEFITNENKNKFIKENTKTITKKTSKKELSYAKPETLFTTEINWAIASIGLDINEYPLFIGPKGCGKDQFARDLAIATKRQFFPINCGAIFKPKQTLIGMVMADKGTTFLIDSEFMKYYVSEEPTLIFLNELSRTPSGAANTLLTAIDKIDPYMYVEELGKRIHKGQNVVFASAANFGYEYTDTRNVDGALLDRFTKVMVDYLEEEEEVNVIRQRVPDSKELEVRKLVKLANHCREDKENLRVGVSTRQLISMAKYMSNGLTLTEVKDNIFINLFVNGSSDEREHVIKLLHTIN